MGKKILIVFTLFFYFLLVLGCSSAESKVSSIVNEFYSGYKGNFREANNRYVSQQLKEMMQRAEDLEDEDALLVKNSKYPTDKPMLIEGDIFTSLYEGHTSFTIKNITVSDDQHAKVMVVFENKKYDEIWEDEVDMVKENNRWKINNVIFKKKSNTFGSTQQYLLQFLSGGYNK